MVVAGLTGKNDTTPYDIAKYSYEKGYYTKEWGTKWDLMSIGIEPFGVIGKKIVLSKQNLFNELNKIKFDGYTISATNISENDTSTQSSEQNLQQ